MTARARHEKHHVAALADHIDFGHLERYTMGEPVLTQELLRSFCEETLAFMRSRPGDVVAERRALHRLKGSARAIGAFPLADAAEWLEKLLEVEAGPDDLREARAELQEQLEALKEACQAWKEMAGY